MATRRPDPLVQGVAEMFRPPPSFTVSEWADAEVYLPEHSARRGSRYDSSVTPYLIEPMNLATAPGVSRIVIQKSSQVGASTMLECIVGYHIAHKPRSMIVALPTQESSLNFMKDRIGSLARRTRSVGAKLYSKRSAGLLRQPESTLSTAWFAGGFLAVVWSGSAQSFAQRAAYLVAADDADRMAELPEGDPIELLERRTLSYHDGRAYVISTPTVAGGRIDTLYRESDMRRWHVDCPACGRRDYLTFSDAGHWHVVFDDKNPATARLACPGCEHVVREPDRMGLIRLGRWLPTNLEAPPGRAGFHIWSAMSGFVALPSLVSGFLEATQRGRETLRAYVNTQFGEAWIEKAESLSLAPKGGVMDEEYEVIPHEACLVTGFMDVQDDRFEIAFCASGPHGALWVMDHTVLGREHPDPALRFDPYEMKDWDRLYRLLFGGDLLFAHASGAKLPVFKFGVDSGYQTPHTYRFSRYNRHVIIATKGVADLASGHLVQWSEDKDAPTRKGLPLLLVNTNACKQRLADLFADGRIHLPRAEWNTDEFKAQLFESERPIPKFSPSGVRIGQKWDQTRARNEVLDLLVGNIAIREAARVLDLDAYRDRLGLPAIGRTA